MQRKRAIRQKAIAPNALNSDDPFSRSPAEDGLQRLRLSMTVALRRVNTFERWWID
jgi:hypothetical protein